MKEQWKTPKVTALEHNTERGKLLPMDEYISLGIELSQSPEGFPFTRFTPSAAKGLDEVAKEFPEYSPSLKSLIERFSTHGMKVVLTKHEGSSNAVIVPGDSTDIETDSIPPRQFETTGTMDPRLKRLIQANMELLRDGEKIPVIESLRANPEDFSKLNTYLDRWEMEVKTGKDSLSLNVDVAGIYRDAGMFEAAQESFGAAIEQAWQEHEDALFKRLWDDFDEVDDFLKLMYANPGFRPGTLRLPQESVLEHVHLLRQRLTEINEELSKGNDPEERSVLEEGKRSVEAELEEIQAEVTKWMLK